MSESGIPRIVAYCRAGFEAEAAADLRRAAAAAAAEVEVDAPTGRGFVVATPRTFDSQRWPRALVEAPPVFIRSLFFGTGPHALFDSGRKKGRPDRVTPLATLIEAFRAGFSLPGASHASRGHLVFGTLHLETPDTNDGKELSGVCKAIAKPLTDAVARRPCAFVAANAAGSPRAARSLHRRRERFRRREPRAHGVARGPWGFRACACRPGRPRARR